MKTPIVDMLIDKVIQGSNPKRLLSEMAQMDRFHAGKWTKKSIDQIEPGGYIILDGIESNYEYYLVIFNQGHELLCYDEETDQLVMVERDDVEKSYGYEPPKHEYEKWRDQIITKFNLIDKRSGSIHKPTSVKYYHKHRVQGLPNPDKELNKE